MYNPPRFESQDIDQAFQLMYQYPFATFISIANSEPIISQIPLSVKKVGAEIVIVGHLARANPHSKYLDNAQCNAVFLGPHAYITPKWYAANDVPTWNYSTVHVKAQCSILKSYDETVDCLKTLRDQAEELWPSGWDFFIPEDLEGERLTKSIVAFQLKLQDVQFKNKLSQNRSADDKIGILQGLRGRPDEGSRGVLAAMEKILKK